MLWCQGRRARQTEREMTTGTRAAFIGEWRQWPAVSALLMTEVDLKNTQHHMTNPGTYPGAVIYTTAVAGMNISTSISEAMVPCWETMSLFAWVLVHQ